MLGERQGVGGHGDDRQSEVTPHPFALLRAGCPPNVGGWARLAAKAQADLFPHVGGTPGGPHHGDEPPTVPPAWGDGLGWPPTRRQTYSPMLGERQRVEPCSNAHARAVPGARHPAAHVCPSDELLRQNINNEAPGLSAGGRIVGARGLGEYGKERCWPWARSGERPGPAATMAAMGGDERAMGSSESGSPAAVRPGWDGAQWRSPGGPGPWIRYDTTAI